MNSKSTSALKAGIKTEEKKKWETSENEVLISKNWGPSCVI